MTLLNVSVSAVPVRLGRRGAPAEHDVEEERFLPYAALLLQCDARQGQAQHHKMQGLPAAQPEGMHPHPTVVGFRQRESRPACLAGPAGTLPFPGGWVSRGTVKAIRSPVECRRH